MAVNYVPEGYRTVNPYLTVGDAEAYAEFLQKAFAGRVTFRSNGPNGRLMHGEVTIGDSKIMIGQARDAWKPMPFNLYMYVEDCDAVYKSATAAGAKSVMDPPTSSTATAMVESPTPKAPPGGSPPTSKTCPKQRSKSARPLRNTEARAALDTSARRTEF